MQLKISFTLTKPSVLTATDAFGDIASLMLEVGMKAESVVFNGRNFQVFAVSRDEVFYETGEALAYRIEDELFEAGYVVADWKSNQEALPYSDDFYADEAARFRTERRELEQHYAATRF